MQLLRTAVITIAWLSMAIASLHYMYDKDVGRAAVQNMKAKENLTSIHQNWRSLLPRKIWQIYLMPPNVDKTTFEIDSENLADTISWLAHNPGYAYVLVGDDGAEVFARQDLKEGSRLSSIFRQLKHTGMKSDLLRYLVLAREGGVYSDIDTVNLKPIDLWVPERYQRDARVVIGVEFDRLDGANWGEVHPDLQFCQWTIAVTPGHTLFGEVIEWVISALEDFTVSHQTTFSELTVSPAEVMRLTGPGAWTDAVFRQLQKYEPDLTSLRNFSGLLEPRLVGDILIFPIDGFGMGQLHSNSTRDGSIPEGALVQHNFRGSWRHNDRS